MEDNKRVQARTAGMKRKRSWCTELVLATLHLLNTAKEAQSVMVGTGICASGKTPLVCVEKGVQVYQVVNRS